MSSEDIHYTICTLNHISIVSFVFRESLDFGENLCYSIYHMKNGILSENRMTLKVSRDERTNYFYTAILCVSIY